MATPEPSTTVAVIGAAGPLGRRVVARVAADPDVARVVAVDRHRGPAPAVATAAPVERIVADPSAPGAERWLAGVDDLVYLAPTTRDAPGADGTGTGSSSAEDLDALLRAADAVGVTHLVVLSSATVYGADADNPVPLTEAAPVRPAPGVHLAEARAELEARAERWGGDGPDRTVARLRPAIAVGPETRRWFARSPWAAVPARTDEGPPLQLVHLDDLADAVAVARRHHLDGPANVAPAEWLAADEVAALAGPAGRFRGVARLLERLRPGARAAPEDLVGTPYERFPWVVASDRLRSVGWSPRSTSAEAFVEVDDPGPLGTVSARRRQQLSLGVVGGVVAGLAVAAAVLWRRRVRGATASR